jgi:hypothetical protein
LEDLINTGYFQSKAIARGVNRFLKVLPDQVTDVPKLSQYFAKTLFVLLDTQAIEPTDIVFYEAPPKKEGEEEEDQEVFIEEYYRMMAFLLSLMYDKLQSWKKVADYFDKNFKARIDAMHPMIMEGNLFNEMPDLIGDDYAKVIVPILDLKQRDKLQAVLKTVQ